MNYNISKESNILVKKIIKKAAATTLSMFGILSVMPSAFCVPPKLESKYGDIVFSISGGNINRVEDSCKLEIIHKKYEDIIKQYNLDPSEIYSNCLVTIPNMGMYRIGGFEEERNSIQKMVYIPGSFDMNSFWKILKVNGIVNENREYSSQWKYDVKRNSVNNIQVAFTCGENKITFLFDSSNLKCYNDIRSSESEVVVNPFLRDFRAMVVVYTESSNPNEVPVDIEESSSDSELLESTSSDDEDLETIRIADTVTSIENSKFFGCKDIGEVYIHNHVDSIGDSCFKGCINLKNIFIPDSVMAIGQRAFENCINLKEIIISNFVNNIREFTFSGCINLEKVHIPNTATSIGAGAFRNCLSLKEVFIPESVKSIGSCAFYDCLSLWKVYIPRTVVAIGKDAFKGCENLKSIVFNGKEYDSVDSFLEAFKAYRTVHVEII